MGVSSVMESGANLYYVGSTGRQWWQLLGIDDAHEEKGTTIQVKKEHTQDRKLI